MLLAGRRLQSWTEDDLEEMPLEAHNISHPRRGDGVVWEDQKAAHAFMQRVAAAHKVRKLTDWRRVRVQDVADMGGRGLLLRHSNSLWAVLQSVYPELQGEVAVWRYRKHLPRGFWADDGNRKAFLDEIREELGIDKPEDWARVSVKDIRMRGGGGLLSTYSSCISRMVNGTYEGMDLPSRKTNTMSTHLGRRDRTVRLAATPQEKELKEGMEGEAKDATECGGVTEKAEERAEREMEEVEEQREKEAKEKEERDKEREEDSVGWGHWRSKENQRSFMDKMQERFNIKEPEDWRRITVADISASGGGGLVKRYGSVAEIVHNVYPEKHISALDCGKRLPAGWWGDRVNRKEFMDRVAAAHNVTKAEEWKRVTLESIVRMGGSRLLQEFATVQAILADVYPEQADVWADPTTCRKSVRGEHWETTENVRSFLEMVKVQNDVVDKADWYRVSQEHVRDMGGAGLLRRYGGLVPALKIAYPDEQWASEGTSVTKKSTQWTLLSHMRKFFGNEVEEDAHPPELRAATKVGQSLELDIYVPEHKLALEYNGQHHYEDVAFFGPVDGYRARDELKQRLCEENGIRLLTVPFWWDRKLPSLAAFLYSHLPSLIDQLEVEDPELRQLLLEVQAGVHDSIPEENPRGTARDSYMRDPHKLLAGGFRPGQVLVRQKLDSISVHWPGSGNYLAYSYGRKVFPPQEWLDQLPQGLECDGELYLGEQQLGSLVYRLFLHHRSARETVADAWQGIEMVIGDSGAFSGMRLLERVEKLKEVVQATPVARVAEYEECDSQEQLQSLLAEHGRLVVNQTTDTYSYELRRAGRHVLRLLESAHVTVVGVSDRSRSLIVSVGDGGTEQTVRCSGAMYKNPPMVGTRVQVLHCGQWKSGRLKYPSILEMEGTKIG